MDGQIGGLAGRKVWGGPYTLIVNGRNPIAAFTLLQPPLQPWLALGAETLLNRAGGGQATVTLSASGKYKS